MSKVILYTAVSLDGYIAELDGSIAFLDDPQYRLPEEDYGYSAFYDSIDTVVMGYNTFAQIQSFEGDYPYQGKESVVLSSKPIADAPSGIEVCTDPCESRVAALKGEGKNVWIIGGGATNAILHEKALIDELYLTFLPITLGQGVPMFRANKGHYQWSTEGVRTYPNGVVQMHLVKK